MKLTLSTNFRPDAPDTNFWHSETCGAREKLQGFSKELASMAIATNGNNVLGEASWPGDDRPESIEP